jgi:hypothetical protein
LRQARKGIIYAVFAVLEPGVTRAKPLFAASARLYADLRLLLSQSNAASNLATRTMFWLLHPSNNAQKTIPG